MKLISFVLLACRVYTTPWWLSQLRWGFPNQVSSGRMGIMKTVMRIVLVAAVACAIYFATIGREQFYALLDFFYDIINAIAAGYVKK
jgi:hypothetical protein